VGLLLTASVVIGVVFVRHESGVPDAIVDLEILKERPFIAANLYNFIYGAGVVGIMSLIPMFAVAVYGISYLESGLILIPRAIGMFITSFTCSMLMMRWGYRWPIVFGTLLAIVSLLLLGLEPGSLKILGGDLSGIVILTLIMLIMGLGVGLAAPASNNACIELMPHRAATITGIRGMFRQAGGAVSITVATLVMQQMNDLAAGFQVVFIGLAIVMLATFPAIFMMPGSPGDMCLTGTREDR